jgi:hypothetical protein
LIRVTVFRLDYNIPLDPVFEHIIAYGMVRTKLTLGC